MTSLLQDYADKAASWRSTAPEHSDRTKKTMQDSSWADGLRGVAAVYVMLSHMTIAFARFIIPPSTGVDEPPLLFQRPIFRLVSQGASWVSLFIILSGFVNALKPLKLAMAGQTETALSNLAVSSFRRSFRLFLPALTATVVSWFICQFGAYETARHSDAYWMATTSPEASYSWGTAIDDLVTAIRDTWTFNPNNIYDQPQWALLYLLLGSTYCFGVLLTTINMNRQYRVLTLIFCWFWGWNWDIKIGAPYVAIGIFFGILMAELFHSDIPLRAAHFSPFFTPPLFLISLFLMSFPGQFQKQAQWSRTLYILHYKIFGDKPFIDRTWPTIGSMLLTITVIMSPHLRRALSHKYLLWLGKISFPLYLLHGTFMRTILAWMLFANSTLEEMEIEDNGQSYVEMKYPLPGIATFVVVMPIFFVILFGATHLWAAKVEPQFALITKRTEEIFCGKGESAGMNGNLGRPMLPTKQDRPD